MSIEITKITQFQVDQILALDEGHFLDLKSKDVDPAKLTRSISALANASGGELYIGIDEAIQSGSKTRTWRGFPDPESANGHIQSFERLFPLGQYYLYTFLLSAGHTGLVLQVNVNKTREIYKASNDIVYVRRGAQNLPITTTEGLARLRLDKGIHSFETETVNARLTVITNSTPILEFLLNVIPTAEPEEWLRKQEMIQSEKPTVAGVLLFAEEPQAILPKRCGVKIYRYRTSTSEGTRETLVFDPITIEGHLYAQIKAAVAKTVELVEDIQKLGPKGLNQSLIHLRRFTRY